MPGTVADNLDPQDLPPEPKGFWDPIRKQVKAWVEQYESDGEID